MQRISPFRISAVSSLASSSTGWHLIAGLFCLASFVTWRMKEGRRLIVRHGRPSLSRFFFVSSGHCSPKRANFMSSSQSRRLSSSASSHRAKSSFAASRMSLSAIWQCPFEYVSVIYVRCWCGLRLVFLCTQYQLFSPSSPMTSRPLVCPFAPLASN